MNDPASQVLRRPARSGWARCRRWLARILGLLLAVPLLYIGLALVGLLPANRGFRAAAADGVDVYVIQNDVHTDILVPAVSPEFDWRTWFPAEHFAAQQPIAEYVQMGWGDRQFYVETPTWADLKLMPTLRAALLPSETVMHVEYADHPAESPRCRRIRLSPSQHARLVQQLRASFATDGDGRPRRIAHAAYHQYDAFYHARGCYHAFRTCNCWTGRTLRASGVRVGCWTPFPQSVMWTLPQDAPAVEEPPLANNLLPASDIEVTE